MKKILLFAVLVLLFNFKIGWAEDKPFDDIPSYAEASAGRQDKPVSLRVRNPQAMAEMGKETRIGLLIRVERHPDNRWIGLIWDSPDGEAGSSVKELRGEKSPRIMEDYFFMGNRGLRLPSGHYVIEVVVQRTLGKYFRTRQEITVQ